MLKHYKLKVIPLATVLLLAPMTGRINASEVKKPVAQRVNSILVVNNSGVKINDSTGKMFSLNGRVYVPLRTFCNTAGIKLNWQKEYPLRVQLEKGPRTLEMWINSNAVLANGYTDVYNNPIIQHGNHIYADIGALAKYLNLLYSTTGTRIEITTEDQYFNDKMVNSAMNVYEDPRLLIQKTGDRKFSDEENDVWNFVRNAKQTRNKRIPKTEYTAEKGDGWKKVGPSLAWKLITPTYDYTTNEPVNGSEVIINGSTGDNLDEKVDKIITDYMKVENYQVPARAKYLDAVAQKKNIEVAYNIKNRLNMDNYLNTFTNIVIDDYVDPNTNNGGVYKVKDKDSLNNTTNNNETNKNDLNKDKKDLNSLINDKNNYYDNKNVYTLGGRNNNDDTYQGSIGIKRYRRYMTYVNRLHGNNPEIAANEFLNNYDIFRSLMHPGTEFGLSSFVFYDENTKSWIQCNTITVSNIHGFVESDLNKGFENYKKDEDWERERKAEENSSSSGNESNSNNNRDYSRDYNNNSGWNNGTGSENKDPSVPEYKDNSNLENRGYKPSPNPGRDYGGGGGTTQPTPDPGPGRGAQPSL